MLILPADFRAPFFAPGRRNRRVLWDRPLSRAIASLGTFERQDWRHGLHFPKGLFGLTQANFAKKHTPGCGSGANCCAGLCHICSGSTPDDMQVDLGTIADGTCTGCVATFSGATVILAGLAGFCVYSYNWPSSTLTCPGPAGGQGRMTLQLGEAITFSDYALTVALYTNYAAMTVLAFSWQQIYTSIDCTSLSSENIPLFYTLGTCTGTPTCLVTAL